MVISGNTRLIAHLGYPTAGFRAPMIYNPWFVDRQVDVKVVPIGVRPEDYAAFTPPLFTVTNIIDTLATIPYKITTCDLVQRPSPTAAIAGAYNTIRREANGSLSEDISDGDGFVLGLCHEGFNPQGARALVIGSSGVGSAIAASLAATGVSALTLYDTRPEIAHTLAGRLHQYYPQLDITLTQHDSVGHELVANATPLGIKVGDPLPLDVDRLTPGTWVGEVVMTQEYTPLLRTAQARQCHIQRGTDMLFEMIPTHLRFLDLPVATLEQLRALAEIRYWHDGKPDNIALYYPVYSDSL